MSTPAPGLSVHTLARATIGDSAAVQLNSGNALSVNALFLESQVGNTADNYIYIGDSNVSATRHMTALAPGESIEINLGLGRQIEVSTVYAIASAADQYLQIGYA